MRGCIIRPFPPSPRAPRRRPVDTPKRVASSWRSVTIFRRSVPAGGALEHDAFGLIGANFGELDWKTPIFRERAAPISPNAW